MSALTPTSHGCANASPPAARIASAVRSQRWGFSSATHTFAPSRANTAAIAAPMPWPAPVTIATLWSSRPIERSRFFQPAVERPRAHLVGEDRVLDGAADARLHRGRGARALHQ